MNSNTMKILGAAIWVFVFDCSHGMNSEEFSWQGCTKHYHECLFLGDEYGTDSPEYKKAFEELLAYLKNDPYSDAKRYEKEVRYSIQHLSPDKSLMEVDKLIENETSSMNYRIEEHNKKECLEFVDKIFVLQEIKAELESQIKEQSIQGYEDQINQAVMSKKPAEALSWIRQEEDEIKQKLTEIQNNSSSDEERTELNNKMSALSNASNLIIKQINEQTKEAYKNEVNQKISNMAHDAATSWLEKQWSDLGMQIKNLGIRPGVEASDNDFDKYQELISKQKVLRSIMRNYRSNS